MLYNYTILRLHFPLPLPLPLRCCGQFCNTGDQGPQFPPFTPDRSRSHAVNHENTSKILRIPLRLTVLQGGILRGRHHLVAQSPS